MYTRILGLLLVGCLMASAPLWAQQEPGYTQFSWDQLVINPAYAGSKDALSARMFYRRQWVGLEGAPQTQSMSLHSPIVRGHMGAGLTLMHDQIGVSRTVMARANLAYKLSLSSGVLSFGMNGQLVRQQTDWGALNPENPGDETLPAGMTQTAVPNFGAGLYYQSDQFYLGAAVPTLLENDDSQFAAQRHMYAMAGGIYRLSPMLQLRGATMFRYLENAPWQLDVQATLIFRETLLAGVGYRHNDSFHILAQYQFAEQWAFGYAFDLTTSALSNNLGSHEVFIGFDLKREKDGYLHPRFF